MQVLFPNTEKGNFYASTCFTYIL